MGICTKYYKYFLFFGIIISLFSVGVSRAAGSTKEKTKQITQPVSQPEKISVWISRSDHSQSCEPKSGTGLNEDAVELKKAGIPVLESRKGNDGKMHIQMCGADQGSLNSFLIPKEKLGAALALGYLEVKKEL